MPLESAIASSFKADFPVYNLVSLLCTVKDKGQIQDFGLVIELCKTGGPCKNDINSTHTRGLKSFSIVAQLTGVVRIQGDFAAGSLLDQLFVFEYGLSRNGIFVTGRI